MTNFKQSLIKTLETEIPELKDKIQAGAVDAQTKPPYAAYSTPEETPIRTIHGIAGYTVSFDLSTFHTQLSECEKLKIKIINALEGVNITNKTCYYKLSEYAFFAEYNLHSYSLTFRII